MGEMLRRALFYIIKQRKDITYFFTHILNKQKTPNRLSKQRVDNDEMWNFRVAQIEEKPTIGKGIRGADQKP